MIDPIRMPAPLRPVTRSALMLLVLPLLLCRTAVALPDGALARLGYGKPEAVAYSPNGDVLAVATSIGMELWDAHTHERTGVLETGSWILSVAFSPDGATLASASRDETVRLWDIASRREIVTLQGHTDWVWSVAFSPDGATLASGGDDATVRLWDVASRQEIATLQGHTRLVWSVAFSSHGAMLASGSRDETVKLWDVASRREIATLQGHTSAVLAVAFSPDGATLASGGIPRQGGDQRPRW